jgi:hypothetical protein
MNSTKKSGLGVASAFLLAAVFMGSLVFLGCKEDDSSAPYDPGYTYSASVPVAFFGNWALPYSGEGEYGPYEGYDGYKIYAATSGPVIEYYSNYSNKSVTYTASDKQYEAEIQGVLSFGNNTGALLFKYTVVSGGYASGGYYTGGARGTIGNYDVVYYQNVNATSTKFGSPYTDGVDDLSVSTRDAAITKFAQWQNYGGDLSGAGAQTKQ